MGRTRWEQTDSRYERYRGRYQVCDVDICHGGAGNGAEEAERGRWSDFGVSRRATEEEAGGEDDPFPQDAVG